MTLFTTLQQFVPQQQLSKVAGRLAASRHPVVKRVFIRSFAKAYNVHLDDYERQSFKAYESFNDFLPVSLKTMRAPLIALPMVSSAPPMA